MKKIKHNLEGKTFGFLKVLRMVPRNSLKERIKWLCECKCGKITKVSSGCLVRGNTKSCGCLRKTNCITCVNLLGKRFGRLLVIGRERKQSKPGRKSVTYWICKCDCGNISKPQMGALRNGRAKSCGCLNKEIQRKRFKAMIGPKNPSFNPDLTQKEREEAKNRTRILEYKKLKNEIVKRDKWCQCCGILPSKDIKFSVHHLRIWKDWPEARLDPRNLIYLCNTCHEEFHWEYGDDFLLSEYDFYKFKKQLLKGARKCPHKDKI